MVNPWDKENSYKDSEDVYNGIFNSLERFCIEFNNYFSLYFKYLKYIFVILLISIGILVFLRLRGVYFKNKSNGVKIEDDPLKRTKIILGFSYIFFGIGFLFNYLIYLLIWILDPLPDRLIFNFLEISNDINPYGLNRIEDIEAAKFPHEQTIYYCIALFSALALIHFVLSIFYFLENTRPILNPKKTMRNLLASLSECIILGFTTSLPFFL